MLHPSRTIRVHLAPTAIIRLNENKQMLFRVPCFQRVSHMIRCRMHYVLPGGFPWAGDTWPDQTKPSGTTSSPDRHYCRDSWLRVCRFIIHWDCSAALVLIYNAVKVTARHTRGSKEENKTKKQKPTSCIVTCLVKFLCLTMKGRGGETGQNHNGRSQTCQKR